MKTGVQQSEPRRDRARQEGNASHPATLRILIVDDTRAIHEDFRKILSGSGPSDFDQEEAEFFESPAVESSGRVFEIDSAYQGREALERVQTAARNGHPYSLVFMDIRMPPGWDGIETTERLWQVDPQLQVVICTAYSDYSWEEITTRLGSRDNFVVLKKPFDTVEVLQLAHSLCRKWELAIEVRERMELLEKRVEERTSELVLANDQLRQAQKMEAVGQLAGGVAHDFNNLLTVILGNSEMALSLSAAPAESELHQCLQQVIATSQKAGNLTRQLLAFSRKQALNAGSVDLNQVVLNLAKMIGRLIGEDIKLEYTYGPGLPNIQADVSMMEQVLMNLVVNARDAMPHGGKLRISTGRTTVKGASAAHPERRAGEYVCLSVKDSGCGIAPEHKAHLFEPFFTTKELGKGTGLGLATVHGIVQQHGGWIEVTTAPGSGTEFQIYLPVSHAPAEMKEKPRNEATRKCGGERILLVEDEELVRKVTARVLEKFGYEVTIATSGRAAVEIWRKRERDFDLLLTDIMMPEGLSGVELARSLLQDRGDLKVILMSGYGGDALARVLERRDLPGLRILQKPFRSAELLRAIQEALGSPAPILTS